MSSTRTAASRAANTLGAWCLLLLLLRLRVPLMCIGQRWILSTRTCAQSTATVGRDFLLWLWCVRRVRGRSHIRRLRRAIARQMMSRQELLLLRWMRLRWCLLKMTIEIFIAYRATTNTTATIAAIRGGVRQIVRTIALLQQIKAAMWIFVFVSSILQGWLFAMWASLDGGCRLKVCIFVIYASWRGKAIWNEKRNTQRVVNMLLCIGRNGGITLKSNNTHLPSLRVRCFCSEPKRKLSPAPASLKRR